MDRQNMQVRKIAKNELKYQNEIKELKKALLYKFIFKNYPKHTESVSLLRSLFTRPTWHQTFFSIIGWRHQSEYRLAYILSFRIQSSTTHFIFSYSAI